MHKYNVAGMQHCSYTEGMTLALGGYVKTLRVRQGLTQVAVLRLLKDQYALEIDRSTLYRAEQGKNWPEGDLLTALMDILGGRLEDLAWLQKHKQVSETKGIDLAESWLRERGAKTDIDTIVEARSRADADELARELEELARKIRTSRE